MEYIKTERNVNCNKGNILLSYEWQSRRIKKPSVLLHSCCGPCSTSVVERLYTDYDVTVLFYNPNITDEYEYILRTDSQKKFIDAFNETQALGDKVGFIEGEYFPDKFLEAVAGFEQEPEGGLRCTKCFDMRLDYTAAKAKMLGYDAFTTTLTVSPHKNFNVISSIASSISFIYGVAFLDMDFKKKAGFQRSIELSKKYDLYRQRFCGCLFSK
ncbi:MAG: epoxyqueuosine reductase QueH [Eubacteriales bacterium]|nr:epoxyqueuosine reductase QueH [Eubacteriales bacterium]